MRYKEVPQLYCEQCGTEIPEKIKGRIRRKDTKFCSQKCCDKFKYEKSSSTVKEFKDDFGLNKYAFKGLTKKLQLIEMFGGKCEKCGYDKNIAAFDFHHRDPFEKEWEIKIQPLNYKNDDDILKEALKCMLLCANCHRELHNPYLDITHVNQVLKIVNK